jgi:hypothetical protein
MSGAERLVLRWFNLTNSFGMFSKSLNNVR